MMTTASHATCRATTHNLIAREEQEATCGLVRLEYGSPPPDEVAMYILRTSPPTWNCRRCPVV